MDFIRNAADLLPSDLNQNHLNLRKIGLEVLELAIESVKPKNLMENSIKFKDGHLIIGQKSYNLKDYQHVYIVGGGKAAADMLKMIENLLLQVPNIKYEGIINIPEGLELTHSESKSVKINYASHPIPNENGLMGTRKMMEIIQKATKDDLIICLISGGGSALLPLPKKGLTLQDLKSTNALLIASGASINEINTVRKHISDFKGGNLAKAVYKSSKSSLLTLIISDVVGDDPSIIASGPTVPDDSRFSDAIEIVRKYSLEDNLSTNVLNILQEGNRGDLEENPNSKNICFEKVNNVLVGRVISIAPKIITHVAKYNYKSIIINSRITGEASQYGRELHSEIEHQFNMFKNDQDVWKGLCLIGVGELTVTLKGNGIGGRNQEMLLSYLDAIKNKNLEYRILVIGVNLDGIEGNSKAMGALIDNYTLIQIMENKLDTKLYLENNDSNSFFKKLQGEIITGPTGSNVNDLIIVLLEKTD